LQLQCFPKARRTGSCLSTRLILMKNRYGDRLKRETGANAQTWITTENDALGSRSDNFQPVKNHRIPK
jgi:hypothetical protein